MDSPTHVAAAPDGRWLAVSGQDGEIVVWSPHDDRIVSRSMLGGRVHRIGWTPDGTALLATIGGSLQLRSADGSTLRATIEADHGEIMGFACHPSQPLVATVGWKGPVRIWDVHSGAHVRDILEKHARATAVAMSETMILAGYAEGWFEGCLLDGELLGHAQIFAKYVAAIAAAPDGRCFVAAGGAGGMLAIDVAPDGLRPGTKWNHPPRPIATNWIDFAADGAFVAAHSDDTATLYRDTNDILGRTLGRPFHRDRKPWDRAYIVSAAVFVPTTSLVAAARFDGRIELWDRRKGSGPCAATLRVAGDRIAWEGVEDPRSAWAVVAAGAVPTLEAPG